MAIFKELNEFVEPNNIKFTFNGKQYEINPSAQIGLEFTNEYRKLSQIEGGLSDENLYRMGAKLMGSKFDLENVQFKGGLCEQLLKDGISLAGLHRLLFTTVVHYQFGEKASKIYYETGNMNKALGLEDEDPKKTETEQTDQNSETA